MTDKTVEPKGGTMDEKTTEACSCPRCRACECCDTAPYPGDAEFGRQMWGAAEALNRKSGRDLVADPIGDYLFIGRYPENPWWGHVYAYLAHVMAEAGIGGVEEAGVPDALAHLVVSHFHGDEPIQDVTRSELMAIWKWAKKWPGWSDTDAPLIYIPRPNAGVGHDAW